MFFGLLLAIKCPLLDTELAQLPAFMLFGDFNNDKLGFVFFVLTNGDTRRHPSRFRLADSAQLTNVARHQSAVRQLCASGHHFEVRHGAHQAMADDSDRERRVDVAWYTTLDDESRLPALVLWLRQPLTHRRREYVHINVLQSQARTIARVNQTHRHFVRDRRVQFGQF